MAILFETPSDLCMAESALRKDGQSIYDDEHLKAQAFLDFFTRLVLSLRCKLSVSLVLEPQGRQGPLDLQ